MAQQLPVSYNEILKLQNLGISQSSIGFTTVTLQSDKYVCIREKLDDKSQLVIIESADPGGMFKRPITADSAIMNPSSKIVALKAGKTLQIFDLEHKEKLSQHMVTDDVMFWRWITNGMIAFVSSGVLYHWTFANNGVPQKVFQVHNQLENNQIISYSVDNSEKWCVLVGVNASGSMIKGNMQLFSVDKNVSQYLPGHAATFTYTRLGGNQHPSNLLIFANRDEQSAKIHVFELGLVPTGNQPYTKKNADIFFQPDAKGDFPIAVHTDTQSGSIYLLTKSGYMYLYEIETMVCFYATKISSEIIFTSVPSSEFGITAISRDGNMFKVKLDPQTFLPYLRTKGLEEIGYKIAERCGFPGAETAILNRFNNLLSSGQYEAGAKLAAKSPGNILRTPEVVKRLQSLPTIPGSTSPLLSYFGVILESGKLNSFESIELCKPVVYQGKKNLLEKWLKDDKLECTEQLGDLVKTIDGNIALSIYLRGNIHEKVLQCFAETGQYQKILLYSKKVNYSADYYTILSMIVRSNPDAAVDFAKQAVREDTNESLDLNKLVDIFMQYNLVNQCTNFLLDSLKGDKPEHSVLQTRLLEMNLSFAPQVAEAIFANNMFSHYDRQHIAILCENAGLMQRAVEHYTDMYDVKKALIHTHLFNPEWLVTYFGTLSVEDSLSCLKVLLESNLRQNLQLCVHICSKYHEQLSSDAIISLFESFRSYEGLFFFLGNIVNFNQDESVHFKYIQAACKIGQIKEVERICKESNYYDPEKVKNFLKEANLSDPLSLIIVCDRFNFVEDLILYLYRLNSLKYIEMYVHKINPSRVPTVIGHLLDLNCGDEFVRKMLITVPDEYDIEQLIEEVSKRNRMKLLMPALENKIANGNTQAATHSALAIVIVDSNANPEKFLRENQYYDPKIVGKFCEKRDAYLSFLAYEHGLLDQDVIRVTQNNLLYKHLSRYLVARKEPELWYQVLDSSNEHRRAIIDQVVQTVLPETQNPDEVSVTVKSFMKCELQNELVELLDKLIMNNTIFSDHRNLQNLLILTSIKADKSRVMDYINRLDNYDAPDIAAIAINNGLYEEAFSIYKKFDAYTSAVSVLINNINNIDRAYEYSERCNQPAVWSILGRAQLDRNLVKEAILSYLKASDITNYIEVITAGKKAKEFETLKVFLELVKKSTVDSYVETQYVYVMVCLGKLEDLEHYISKSTHVDIISVGDICYEEGYYDAAKIIFSHASNFPKLAATYLKLEKYSSAVECAKKANNIRTWREVSFVCIEKKEFKLGQLAGLYIVVNPEELSDLIRLYEGFGYFDELLTLLEASIGLERAHMGLFTELANAYSKYKPKKLREFLEMFSSRVNIPQVLNAAERAHLWNDMVFLYEKYEEYDNALNIMMQHPVDSWHEIGFKDIASRVANAELLYRAANFYLEQHPLLLNELLIPMSNRLDHNRTIKMFKMANEIALVKPYLEHIQKVNVPYINETLNDLYIEEGLYDDLRRSITTYTNFDMIAMAEKLEKHELMEFRRISNQLYKQSNRWNKSIEQSAKDGLDMDAIEIAAESKDSQQAYNLLKFLTSNRKKDSIVILLYHCYDILKPDDVLEYCAKHKVLDYAMPYFVQLLSDIMPQLQDVRTKIMEKEEEGKINEQPSVILKSNPMLIAGPGVYSYQSNVSGGPPGSAGYRPF